jgi:hypothetical protein
MTLTRQHNDLSQNQQQFSTTASMQGMELQGIQLPVNLDDCSAYRSNIMFRSQRLQVQSPQVCLRRIPAPLILVHFLSSSL